ncbi:MAG: alpha/beta hydrolase [Acidimicrobiales bacterium mtb01]|nr:alpha/beta hydrolase [Actinomycetota bacterium]TEX45598.1 MAG: alpha/beta hydrolase [Acidimicrobiales bacterium mtb01]
MKSVVLVHGNPETSAIWTPLVEALSARGASDVIRLTPPGFGSRCPEGWSASQVDYRSWLVAEIESIGRPVHIVGHDWGAGHVYGAISVRPELFASWAADCGGLIHPDYEWHDAAQGWQTPDVGEEMVAGLVSLPVADKTAAFAALGMTESIAAEVASWVDDTMGRCILALYRSAAQPAMRELGDRLASRPPGRGAVIVPTADPYPGTPAMAREVASRLGATTIELADRGHWWMIEAPEAAAAALVAFWKEIES